MKFPMLADGAMGTMLQASGLTPGECGEAWVLTRPEAVAAIHKGYADAGARIMTANTFGASRIPLARHRLADLAHSINREAVALARTAVGGDAFVYGDVGPLGVLLEPFGDLTEPDAESAFRSQIESLATAGADGILIETMSDPAEAAIAVRVAREFGDWPVVATFAFQQGLRTFMGSTVEQAVLAAAEAGASLVGANCGTDLTFPDYLQLASELLAHAHGLSVALQPNAGKPEPTQDGFVYRATPESFAGCVDQALALGVSLVGGCCGTTPAHIRAAAERLAS